VLILKKEVRMAARHDENDTGQRKLRILQPCGSNMPLQMADANEGKPECVCQALGVIDPNDQRTSKARSLGDRKARQVGP
jgi:hypothetical protein